jgi:hypothetical protein
MVAIHKNKAVAKFIREIGKIDNEDYSSEQLEVFLDTEFKVQYKKLLYKFPGLIENKRKDFNDFKKRLRNTYTPDFKLFEIFIELFRETGDYYREEFVVQAERESNYTFLVLNLMYARVSQIGQEIFTLMENGYSDGAYARWRTLFETTVFAKLIHENGADTAKRYLDYAIVEQYNEAESYKDLVSKYNFPDLEIQDYIEIKEEYKRVIELYGEDFSKKYGWANKILKPKERNLWDMAVKVNLEFETGYYKLACNNVHSGPISQQRRIASINKLTNLAGASNIGQKDVGIVTLHSLYKIASLFFTIYSNSQIEIVRMLLCKMVEEIEREFSLTDDLIRNNI